MENISNVYEMSCQQALHELVWVCVYFTFFLLHLRLTENESF